MLGLPLPPRSSWLLLWLLLTGSTGVVRFALRDLLVSLQNKPRHALIRVAVYGAGAAGVQLAAALRHAGSHSVELFLDDAPRLWSRDINGIPIQPPQILRDRLGDVDQVLLAIPSLSRSQRRRIVDGLQEFGIPVLQVPSVQEIASGRARIDALRPIAIEELLGRDAVPPDPQLLGPGISGQVVMVSGAGGSIGAELCRQILALRPRRLVLLERSEPSLYAIDQELRRSLPAGVELVAVLGSVADRELVGRVLQEQAVEVEVHAIGGHGAAAARVDAREAQCERRLQLEAWVRHDGEWLPPVSQGARRGEGECGEGERGLDHLFHLFHLLVSFEWTRIGL
jgi:FlaA1/EpsC-like NDP-sugar epimerase